MKQFPMRCPFCRQEWSAYTDVRCCPYCAAPFGYVAPHVTGLTDVPGFKAYPKVRQ